MTVQTHSSEPVAMQDSRHAERGKNVAFGALALAAAGFLLFVLVSIAPYVKF